MSTKKREAIFIRHGQSLANIGQWRGGFAEAPLTALGEEQARALAETWAFTPCRIMVSPYVRTRQTAAPTIARFPDVPVEFWDIHEFTFWDPAFWGEIRPEDDLEEVARYWRVADPEYRHGSEAEGTRAETFAELLERTEETLKKLEAMECDAPVLLFTHGHFMQALRHTLKWPQWTKAEKMANFYAYDQEYRVMNTELIRVVWDEQQKWQLV